MCIRDRFWGFAQAAPSTVMQRLTTGIPVARYLPRVETEVTFITMAPEMCIRDRSKYSPTEFIPGCIYYQGDHSPNEAERAARGYSSAWLHRKRRIMHHLEYWIDYSTRKAGLAGMKMPLRYVCEMVCDRVAASQIYLGDRYTDASPWEYYERSKTHYLLHPETRALLEELLKMVRDLGHDRTFEHMKYLLGCEKDY